jgi:phosphoglycolate phosphatase-like HAD superfamily hydrolase
VNPLLLLWDIDHTLTENHGVNKETYGKAFELLTGKPAEYRARTDGRLEPEVMRDMLALHGIEPTSEHVARMPWALETATTANAGVLRERGHELDGARDALAAFSRVPEVVQAVLSGNIRSNAVTKLAVFGLDRYMDFEVGGYGEDGEDRASLVPVAQGRATEKYRQVYDKTNTVLVGDTLRDVQAGLTGGARVIAVATGADSVQDLRSAGAHIVLPDLADTQAVMAAVTGLAG